MGVLYLFVREPRVYLRFGFVWECLQSIVVIFTVIVKIYCVASCGCRHIAEPCKFLVSYFLLSLFFNLVLTDYFTQYAQQLSNIMLEVTTNFVPVRFSTARLLQKPIRLTIKPIKKQKTKKKLFFTMAPVVKKTTVSAFCCINNDLSSSSSSSSSSISREPMAAVAASILANAPAAAPVSVSASANAAQDWTVASSADRRDDKPALASSKGSLYFFKDEIFETFFFFMFEVSELHFCIYFCVLYFISSFYEDLCREE